MLTIAVKAARRAGSLINQAARDVDVLTVTRKRQHDYVTEVDKAAEAAIIEILQRAYPDHAILAEESGATRPRNGAAASEYTWIIDPLDGTTNFIHGFQQYSVSIGVQHKGVLAHGVIYDPTRNELFAASRGRGAFLNDRRMRVSRRTSLGEALVGTGFPFRELKHLDRYLAMLGDVMTRSSGVRRAGSAALDLAWVACGRLDAFWEIGLSPWDMAAGALMVTEAGGLVSDFKGDSGWMESGSIVCGTPKVFAQLLQAVAKHAR